MFLLSKRRETGFDSEIKVCGFYVKLTRIGMSILILRKFGNSVVLFAGDSVIVNDMSSIGNNNICAVRLRKELGQCT